MRVCKGKFLLVWVISPNSLGGRMLWIWFACQSGKTSCVEDVDCGDGVCSPDGTCIAVVEDTGLNMEVSNEPSVDTSDVDTDDTAADGLCIPNQNGILERTEYPSRLDLQVPFRYSEDSPIDLVGLSGTAGQEWDFSGTVNGEEIVVVGTPSPSTFWFSEHFPDSTYVTVLSYRNSLYGIFTLTEQGLFLDGVASFEGGFTETLLSYDPPASILTFPMEVGSAWTVQSTVTGTLNGVYSYHLETQDSTVDKAGFVETPLGRFPTLRVHTETTREVGWLTYVSQSVAFTAECYGTVVTAASNMDETNPNFQTAFELLRIAP